MIDVADLRALGREELVLERCLRMTAEDDSDDQSDKQQK
jgi:hypothetical protein